MLDAGADMTTYSWNTGAITQTITVRDSGTFIVQVSDTSTCTHTDTAVISTYPAFPVKLGNDTSISRWKYRITGCRRQVQQLRVWNTTQQSQADHGRSSGKYFVAALDDNLCLNRDTIEITVKLLPDATFTSTLQGSKRVDFIANNSFRLYPTTGILADTQTGSGQTISHTYAAEGIFEVILTVSDGECSDTSIQQVEVTTLGIAKNTRQ